ncbi:Y-family of DNA polymerase [Metarhizium album ARSEF 1941]|uniref:DNA repair protein REV1 n=1 Tax=Metarhizium album (strain ARSEF 1941) TaxID=1081103 RepID=A0A0B2X0P9_METAS|nr:Y-family of DNA polymerase [Metarhizium album ARSEF 1941]KHN99868.1 Y-family of DNA polymerase [Metarhizium album ARSEF 1941]
MGSVLEKNSSLVRKRIENHKFQNEDGDEYEGSEFGGFGDYFRRKKTKLQNLDADLRAASDKPQIFKGIVAHVTGYTQPPLHVLHRQIVEHGGGFLQYLDSKTMATHIVASTLPPKKSVDFARYRIVKPAWIVDSVAAGKLMPWVNYRVLDEGPRQKVLKFDGEQDMTQVSPETRRGYKEQTDNSFYTSQLKSSTALPSQSLSQFAEKIQSSKPPGSLAASKQEATVEKRPSLMVSPESDPASGVESPGMVTATGHDISADHHVMGPAEQPHGVVHAVSPSPAAQPRQGMTSEEHNAWLLSDPRLRKSSTANPEFLKQFYSESRLHHLSTWKADLKSAMQRLAAEKGLAQKKSKKKPGARCYIMHVDFDSFFCAVSLRQHSEDADKPTVVAHSSGPGSEIASCNYPARKFGVTNGMWMKRAIELCPDLKVLPYDFPAYEEASRLFYESVMSIGGVVQSVSVDEALIDATAVVYSASNSQGIGIDEGNVWREQEKADEIAMGLRESIKAKTGCDVSVGIGGNILQARVALRKAKPAGQFQLKPERVLDIVGELTVEQLPGVSHSIGGKLEELGIKFVKDIRNVSKERLAGSLGPKTSEKLSDYARGIDRTEVGEQPPRKSVSAEVNWGIRFISQQEAEEFVFNLCRELEKRLVNEQVRGTHLTMKIMRRCLDAPLDPAKHLGHGRCDTFNKSATFGVATHNYETIGKEAVSILRSFKFSPGDLRGLGVQMTRLEPIKAQQARPTESSQRTLSFGPFVGASSAKKPSRTESIDDIESPQKPKRSPGHGMDADPIADDPLTPRKQKVHPAMALSRAAQEDAKANTPLNVSGTQFILPSNPDPAVISELPNDIRSRLMGQRPRQSPSPAVRRCESPSCREAVLPSQIDADVFNALPDDMKAEVLATYGRRPAQPQSPRRQHHVAQQPRKQTTPTKRGGIRGIFGKAQRQRDAQTGVVQTNFKTLRPGSESPIVPEMEELDAEFLAELPEDVRREVVADHRRRRMALRSGLDAPPRRHHTPDTDTVPPGGQRKITFPAPPRKVAFASSGVTSTREVKNMLDAWHAETRRDGPHSADVEVFGKYVQKVVEEERDLEKVVVLTRWLQVLVEQDARPGRGQDSWREAVKQVKRSVQGAVEGRGLAPLELDI